MSRRSLAGAVLLAASLVGGPALVLAQDASVMPSVPASMAPVGSGDPCPEVPMGSPMASMAPGSSVIPMPSVVAPMPSVDMVPEMSGMPVESMVPVMPSADPCASPMVPMPSMSVESPPASAPA